MRASLGLLCGTIMFAEHLTEGFSLNGDGSTTVFGYSLQREVSSRCQS